jgi:hypothetical protein
MPVLGNTSSHGKGSRMKPVVTGGTLTNDGTYYYRTYTSNGTLGVSISVLTADVLMVAGGGGGGGATGGGGGAGGIVYSSSQTFSSDKAITIGGGGGGGTGENLSANGRPTRGTNGTNTTFATLTSAVGGGGGGNQGVNHTWTSNGTTAGLSGGSGGGGAITRNSNAPRIILVLQVAQVLKDLQVVLLQVALAILEAVEVEVLQL